MPALLSASGINYYGDTGAREVDETAPVGRGLPRRGRAGTGRPPTAARAAPPGRGWCCCARRRCSPRPAACSGRLRPLFRLALGGRIGTGRQYFPWISLDDEVGAIRFLLEHDRDRRPGQPGRPGAGHQRRVHRGAGRGGRTGPAPFVVPAFALRSGARADGRGDGAHRPAGRAGELLGGRLPVPAPHRREALVGGAGSGRELTGTMSSSSAPGSPGCARPQLLCAPRARRGAAGRRRPARRAGGHRRRSTASAATAGSRCSTPPTRRCAPRPTWTRSTCAPFEPGAAVRGADGRLHVLANPLRRPGADAPARPPTDGLLPPLRQGEAGRLDGAGAGRAARRRTARRIDRSAAAGPRRRRARRPGASTGSCARSCPACSARPS